MNNSLVLTTALRHDRSYTRPNNSNSSSRSTLRPDPPLLLWRRLLDHATAEAKKTIEHLPSDMAILARWWIADCQPSQADKDDWSTSFDCACHWLGLNVVEERKKRLKEIDEALHRAWMELWFEITYVRRAMVMTCTGHPTAIAGQFFLPLASVATYDEVAGIEAPDMFAEMERCA